MKEVTVKQAFALMIEDPEYVYLDVRSVPEFEAGHPQRAINIPLMHFTQSFGMSPNEDFAAVVEANIPRNTRLVIGCKTGGRSMRACEVLSQMGYTDVANVRGGFAGQVDHSGAVLETGWSMAGLPICGECKPGSSYDALLDKTRK